MLSVLSTPWTKPAANHSAPSRAHGADDRVVEAGRPGRAPPRLRASSGRCSGRRGGGSRPISPEGREPLEGADADVAVDEADEDRGAGRRGLVAADQRLAGLDQREGLRGVDAERLEHLGGEDLAHAALERQPAVAHARPGRRARALGAEVEQAAVARGRAAGRRGSRGRRRGRGCTRGTGGRGSAAPAARGSCRAAARSGRSGRSRRRRRARRGRPAPPSGRCGSAAASPGSPRTGPRRRRPSPRSAWARSGLWVSSGMGLPAPREGRGGAGSKGCQSGSGPVPGSDCALSTRACQV